MSEAGGTVPVAVIQTPVPARRAISECIALAKKHEEEAGEAPVLDADFAADVEKIIRNRKPRKSACVGMMGLTDEIAAKKPMFGCPILRVFLRRVGFTGARLEVRRLPIHCCRLRSCRCD